jgi:hypothetical protein
VIGNAPVPSNGVVKKIVRGIVAALKVALVVAALVAEAVNDAELVALNAGNGVMIGVMGRSVVVVVTGVTMGATMGVTIPGTIPKTLAVRLKPGRIVPTGNGTATEKAPIGASGAMIGAGKNVENAGVVEARMTWLLTRSGVKVRLAKAVCIWAMMVVWTDVASARLLALRAPQLRSGSVVAVSIGVQVSGAMTCADCALDVCSGADPDGSFAPQAAVQTATAPRTLSHFLDTMVRSS